MKYLRVDYISDLHLGFYLPYDSDVHFRKEDIKSFVEKAIKPQVNGEILLIAGDICEDVDCLVTFLKETSKYYKKVFVCFGNHEYYFVSKLQIYEYMTSEFKIAKMIELLQDEENIIVLDRNEEIYHGLYIYNGFSIAGDTLWYLPKGAEGWDFYMNNSNDSRAMALSGNAMEDIMRLHMESVEWYDNLPSQLDLIVTHVPPVLNPSSRYGYNSCYLCDVNELKTKTWIYGHDHIIADFAKSGTRFLSNPWGYNSKNFKIKTIDIVKDEKELISDEEYRPHRSL